MSNENQLVGTPKDMREWLESDAVSQKLLAVSSGDPERVKRSVAMACLAAIQNPKIGECVKVTVLDSLMRAAALGLAVGDPIRGEAYLVPFKQQCTLMLGYRGLQKLIRRGGEIKEIYSHPVYKQDQFAVRLGDNPGVDHVPDWRTPHRDADIVAFYAVAKWAHGGHEVCVMQRSEVDAIMEGVKRKNGGKLPDSWQYAYAETAKKCPIRRIAKQLPLTSEAEKIMHETEAVEADDDVRENVTAKNPLLAATERVMVETTANPVVDEVEAALARSADKPIDPGDIDALTENDPLFRSKP